MQVWKLGSATVTRIEEQVGPNDSTAGAFLPDLLREKFDRHASWMVPVHYDPASDRLITSNHSWLIRTGRHTILLDSCAGNHKERPWLPRFHQLNTPFLERLRDAGASPGEIDIVLCTHLHADHVGWNTRLDNGRWVPTFPNARYLFSRTENDHWNPAIGDRRQRNPGRALMYDDSVLPVIQSGQAILLEGEHAIEDSVLVKPAPGHTPGHVILDFRDGAAAGLFCGDVIHHPVQVYEPAWNTRFCELPEDARATRRRVLEHCAEQGALLFPTHFAAPHVAAVRAAGDGFRLEFVQAAGGSRS
jgi:glyoxylase-like metal-dependent hydrolase (beta-lactamase superfamily II)